MMVMAVKILVRERAVITTSPRRRRRRAFSGFLSGGGVSRHRGRQWMRSLPPFPPLPQPLLPHRRWVA